MNLIGCMDYLYSCKGLGVTLMIIDTHAIFKVFLKTFSSEHMSENVPTNRFGLKSPIPNL